MAEQKQGEGRVVFSRPKALLPVVTNYCPGCPHGIVHRLVSEVIDELEPQPGDHIIPKKTYSGFFQTPLELVLRELDVDTVIITGWQADCCCRHTSADAFFRGFKIIVPRETTDTTTEEGYQGGLGYIQAIYGATICDLADIMK